MMEGGPRMGGEERRTMMEDRKRRGEEDQDGGQEGEKVGMWLSHGCSIHLGN